LNPVRRNTIANVVGRVATALLWVAITPYVLVRLGPERFGIWALFFSFSGYLISFDLGISNTMVRFVATGRASGGRQILRKTLVRGLRLALGLGLFWALVVVLTRHWIASAFHVPTEIIGETLDALGVFAVGVLLLFPTQVLTGALQGFERLDHSNLCVLLGVTAQMPILYLGIAAGGGLMCVAAAGAIGQAVTGLFAAVLLRRELRRVGVGEGAPGPAWRDLIGFGAALQVTGILIVVQLQASKIMLGLMGNLSMVADYEIASRVASGVASLPISVLGAVIPAASRLWESDGPTAVLSLFTSVLRWFYSQSVMILGLLWVTAPDITRIWLGPGHDHIAFLIRLWAVAFAVSLAWNPAAAVARGIGLPWLEVWSLAASVVANIALGYWCVPRYGAVGAIAVVGAAYAAGFIAFAIVTRHARLPLGPWIRRELLPRAVVGCLAVALCAGLIAARPLADHLPPPGWAHATLAALLFLTIFSIFFLPLGDTQRLFRTLRQMTTSPWARGRTVASS
jgi:O-antigen/teichoic acid export membrane protein